MLKIYKVGIYEDAGLHGDEMVKYYHIYGRSVQGWMTEQSFPQRLLQLFKEIKDFDPDHIIIDCHQECDHKLIFKNVYPFLISYLNQYNKNCTVITTDYSQESPNPRITLEANYGYLLGFYRDHFENIMAGKCPIINYIAPLLPEESPTKLFTCYNHRASIHRLKMVDALVRENLLDKGIVTYAYPHIYWHKSNDDTITWKYHDRSILRDEPDFKYRSSLEQTGNYLPRSFMTAWFDIVTESRADPYEFFVTEKTLKSLFAFKPFMILGPKGFHHHLVEKYDLELYTEWFNYDFDLLDNVDDRVEGIIDNVKRLMELNQWQLKDLRHRAMVKLIKNKLALTNIIFDKYRIIPKCLQGMFDKKLNVDYEVKGIEPEFVNHMKTLGW